LVSGKQGLTALGVRWCELEGERVGEALVVELVVDQKVSTLSDLRCSQKCES
jgi:hypothetical protein